MKKNLLAFILAISAIPPCMAADLGLGLAIGGSGSENISSRSQSWLMYGQHPSDSGLGIYIPVTLDPHFRMEGFLAYDHEYVKLNEQHWDPSGGRVVTTNSPSSLTSLGGSLGIFWVRPMTECTHVYLGPRIGYSQTKQSRTLILYDGTSSGQYTLRTETNRLHLAPVLGFEYFPIKSFSLGGEVGMDYSRSHTSDHGSITSIKPDHSEEEGTFTSIILRYYF